MESLIANVQENIELCKNHDTVSPEIAYVCREMIIARTYDLEFFKTLKDLSDPMDEPFETVLEYYALEDVPTTVDTPDKRFLDALLRHHREGLNILKSIHTIEVFNLQKAYEKEIWTIKALLESAQLLWRSPLLD